jgi:hypothetical protein
MLFEAIDNRLKRYVATFLTLREKISMKVLNFYRAGWKHLLSIKDNSIIQNDDICS